VDPRRVYEAEPGASGPRPKSKVAPSISDNVNYAAAATILRRLENGLATLEAELDAQNIEHHLGSVLSTNKKPRPDSRNATLKARLDKHRAKVVTANAADEKPAAVKLPAPVAAALDIIAGSRPVTRTNRPEYRRELIKQMESDRDEILKGIHVQQAIVDDLRNELSGDMARRLQPDHKKLMLAQFRAAQAFAAATDDEAQFRISVIGAGYMWRADLLQGPQLRAALVLGSESTFDSDISRARRMLEDLNVL
jgi:hypothetical protein